MESLKLPQISKAKLLTVGAMCVALAFMLNQVSLFRMPMGGSVTPMSMLFIVFAGYWLGPVYGVITGVTMGFLDMALTGFTGLHPLSILFDYLLGFGVLGISGFFRKMKFGLQIGYVAAVFGRWCMVFLSGWIVFGIYAPEGQHAAVYSAIYNLNYIAPEMIATFVIISLPSMKYAIDIVTKSIVPPAVYQEITSKGSVSVPARITTGAVVGMVGGFAFVISSYLKRMEYFAVTQIISPEFEFFEDSRLIRMLERNTQQIFALNTVGVIFIVLSAALLISTISNLQTKSGYSEK